MTPLLEIKNMTKNFGGLRVLDDVSLHVNKGEILGLIGPNGAGKTTLFNVISGVYKCNSGQVIFNGEDITGLKPHAVAKKGMVRTFQHMVLWRNFTVLENMRAALHMRSGFKPVESVLSLPSSLRKEKKVDEEAMKILEFVDMTELKDQVAGSLSHGYRRTMTLGIGAASEPPLLLLDEPVTALSPERVGHIMSLIRKVRDDGTTLVIVEHNMRTIFDICDRIVVLNVGRKIAEGTPDEIKENQDVINAYLGGGTFGA